MRTYTSSVCVCVCLPTHSGDSSFFSGTPRLLTLPLPSLHRHNYFVLLYELSLIEGDRKALKAASILKEPKRKPNCIAVLDSDSSSDDSVDSATHDFDPEDKDEYEEDFIEHISGTDGGEDDSNFQPPSGSSSDSESSSSGEGAAVLLYCFISVAG